MRYVALAFLAAALSGSAFAADVQAPAKTEKPKKEKKICRSFVTSESRLGATVCKTAAEWANNNNVDVPTRARSIKPEQ